MRELPEGWRLVRMNEICTQPGQYGSGAAAIDYDPSLPRYVRVTDLGSYGLNGDTHASIRWADAKPYMLTEGDLVFARSGTVGKIRQGAQPNINSSEYGRHQLPLPPLVEQRRIAEIRDAIDGDIECTQELIDKHSQLRRAVLEAAFEEISRSSPHRSLGELSVSGGDYGSNAPSVPYLPGLPRYVRITDIDDRGRLRPDSVVGHARFGVGQYLLEGGRPA